MVGGGGFAGLGAINQFMGAQSGAEDSSEIIAKVNGEPILRGDFEQQLKSGEQQSTGTQSALMSGVNDNQALDSLISDKLVLQLAAKHNVTVSDSEVASARSKAINDIKSKLGLSAGASEDTVKSTLSGMGYSLDSMLSNDKIKDDLMKQKYFDQIKILCRPSDAQLEASYTKFHTQHILIDNKKRPDAQAIDLAKKIIAELNTSKGANFDALAKQYSEDPGTKSKGGDDGWIDPKTSYVQAFKDAAFALNPGQWTQTPVKTDEYGYFIIKLDAKKVDKPKDFDKNKENYIQQTTNEAAEKMIESEMKQAHDAAKIEVIDAHLNGDWLFMNAYKNLMSNPTGGQAPATADLNKALAAYNTALKQNPSTTDIAQIQSQRAVIFDKLNNAPQKIIALQAAFKATKGYDPQIALQLGDAYKKTHDVTNAVNYYDAADKFSGQDISIHMQLQSDYKDLGRTDLVQKEKAWIDDYNLRNKGNASSGMKSIQMPSH
jgi:parvulin-like peptidyl-prolyl isomerase